VTRLYVIADSVLRKMGSGAPRSQNYVVLILRQRSPTAETSAPTLPGVAVERHEKFVAGGPKKWVPTQKSALGIQLCLDSVATSCAEAS
jgi:hypothetical protein